MDHAERSDPSQGQRGLNWAPIHSSFRDTPLLVALLLPDQADPSQSPFALLREIPGARIYLGAICDAQGRLQEWVEVWIQEPDVKNAAASVRGKPLDNGALDERWRSEFERAKASVPEAVIVTGMELEPPAPVLIKNGSGGGAMPFARSEISSWRLCTDDQLLKSRDLPPYSTSCHRYLYNPDQPEGKTFIATASEAPVNANVQPPEQLTTNSEGVQAVFNAHAGLVRVMRFSPLELEDYLQLLEGRAWAGPFPEFQRVPGAAVYRALAQWSENRRGPAFLLSQEEGFGQRLDEVFFLKAAALLQVLRAVRAYVQAHQIPLLNLTPASFRVGLADVGDQFPALWTAKLQLVRPSQAFPLNLPFAAEKYFIRLGRMEPSPFLPEGLGAASFGTGSIRLRSVSPTESGVVLEGTLIAEDYLGVNAQDLLWFKLPLREDRLEFYAQIFTSDLVGPKEARFRTVPSAIPDGLVNRLKAAAGTAFQRAPYEIYPLLSSPCDLYSIGVLGVRILLANSRSNLPVILDEILSLARRSAREANETEGLSAQLKAMTARERDVLDRVSPHALIESGDSPEQARTKLPMDLWLEAVALLLRFFPGLGQHSFCRNLGDAPPDHLEAVFDRPIAELEKLVRQLRQVLVPSVAAKAEITQLLLEELAAIKEP